MKRRKKKQSELLQQQQQQQHEQVQTLLPSKQKRKTSSFDHNEDEIKSIKIKTKTTSSSATEANRVAVDQSTSIPELLVQAQLENVDYSKLATDLMAFIISSDSSSLQDFYANYWGRSAHHSQRGGQTNRFRGVFSRKTMRQLLQNHAMYLSKDIDISQHFQDTKTNGFEKEDEEDYDGGIDNNDNDATLVVADSKDVWEHFERGHTVCLLSPQVYDDPTWQLLSLLEIEFEAVVGCHVYLLPPNSRAKGFGRRVASADFIVLQLEGASEWSVGRAEDANESESIAVIDNDPLAAIRSKNKKNNGELGQSDDMKVILQQGDTVYVPKGYAYESVSQLTSAHAHSLYLVLFTNEADSYHSMLELVVPTALQSVLEQSVAVTSSFSSSSSSSEGVHKNTAATTTTNTNTSNGSGGSSMSSPAALAAGIRGAVAVPRSLPHKRFDFLGVASSELDEHPARDAFTAQLRGILRRVATRAEEMADAAVDQVKKHFMVDRLPVPLSPYEERYSSAGFPGAQIFPFTELRAVRPLCGCVVVEDGKVLVFHCMDNSM